MIRAAIGLLVLCALAGCGVAGPSGGQSAANAPSRPAANSAAAPTGATDTGANSMPSQPQNKGQGGAASATSAPAQAFSAQQTEALARADLAAFLKVAPDEIQLVSAAERTWPDKGLGCAAGKGFYEPQQIPGYEISLAHGGATFRYHADQQGRLIRCSTPGKPLGPISR